jgi:hypothetical protein
MSDKKKTDAPELVDDEALDQSVGGSSLSDQSAMQKLEDAARTKSTQTTTLHDIMRNISGGGLR